MEGYEVLKVLGEGSFGRALLVHHKITDQKYAMKEIRLPMSSSDVENSRKEAILLAKMKHPNIVAYKESFEADGHLYIVMEYCDDGDLTEKIKHQRGKLFPEDMILHWFVQMCLGVKHIHDKRVLHRDIKSKNVFLTQNGKVKLGDFGSARLLAHPGAYACTYVGTPYYVPPEIWESMPYNNKSDIWSLGCILYELCTLTHPFQAKSWKHLILKICRGSYNPLPSSTILKRSCLAKFIKHCLPPEVADEFKQTLKETRKHEGTALRPQGSVAAGGSSNKKESKQSKDESSKHSNLKSENISKDLNKCTKEQRKTDAEAETPEVLPGITDSSHPQRRKWEKSFTPEDVKNGSVINYSEHKPRKQWNKETPHTLMNFLSNAEISLAFKTYTIYKAASENTLRGPLADETEASEAFDKVDGEHEDVIDRERLEPRSDEDDTDFEEDDADWVSELEMVLKHSD
uniref:NIMA related kinase 3 n=1 Tax=Anas platyrhynchos TaxID=8839 RepID=A0A8B9QU23_ANAPL